MWYICVLCMCLGAGFKCIQACINNISTLTQSHKRATRFFWKCFGGRSCFWMQQSDGLFKAFVVTLIDQIVFGEDLYSVLLGQKKNGRKIIPILNVS